MQFNLRMLRKQSQQLHTGVAGAANDPFVPPEPFRNPALAGNPHITTVIEPDGGHCAFVERAVPGYDGYWAEREIVRFVSAQAAR